jgi:hypothetical protein
VDHSRLNENSLHRAIVEALAYSDVFDYPLRVAELQRYLPLEVPPAEVAAALRRGVDGVDSCEGYYFLRGRSEIVAQRLEREMISRPVLVRALRYGRLLGSLPFIRMAAVTGSLSMLNADETGDIDYMLIAARGRVWTARAFALVLARLVGRSGYTLCPNLVLSERRLVWSDRDLYTAHEICQMIPVSGQLVYDEFRSANAWTADLLPNAIGGPPLSPPQAEPPGLPQSLLEWPLRGELGQRLENWEMSRKIRRFSRQAGFGAETHFDADVCQGNFDHHGAETRRALRSRLAALQPQPVSEAVPVE